MEAPGNGRQTSTPPPAPAHPVGTAVLQPASDASQRKRARPDPETAGQILMTASKQERPKQQQQAASSRQRARRFIARVESLAVDSVSHQPCWNELERVDVTDGGACGA